VDVKAGNEKQIVERELRSRPELAQAAVQRIISVMHFEIIGPITEIEIIAHTCGSRPAYPALDG
jgi:hypothetical protein